MSAISARQIPKAGIHCEAQLLSAPRCHQAWPVTTIGIRLAARLQTTAVTYKKKKISE